MISKPYNLRPADIDEGREQWQDALLRAPT